MNRCSSIYFWRLVKPTSVNRVKAPWLSSRQQRAGRREGSHEPGCRLLLTGPGFFATPIFPVFVELSWLTCFYARNQSRMITGTTRGALPPAQLAPWWWPLCKRRPGVSISDYPFSLLLGSRAGTSGIIYWTVVRSSYYSKATFFSGSLGKWWVQYRGDLFFFLAPDG